MALSSNKLWAWLPGEESQLWSYGAAPRPASFQALVSALLGIWSVSLLRNGGMTPNPLQQAKTIPWFFPCKMMVSVFPVEGVGGHSPFLCYRSAEPQGCSQGISGAGSSVLKPPWRPSDHRNHSQNCKRAKRPLARP